MARFVNFKKRSVTLPKGCKDLIDLLRPDRKLADAFPAAGGFPDFLSKTKVTTVSEVIPAMQALELSTETPWFVQVCPVEGEDCSVCFSNPGETVIPGLFLIFMDRPELKAGVLEVLGRQGLTVATLDEAAPPPFPGMPFYCAWRITGPLPEVTGMGALARQLLTEGLGLPADATVRVNHELLE
jgi:hypothetical protein